MEKPLLSGFYEQHLPVAASSSGSSRGGSSSCWSWRLSRSVGCENSSLNSRRLLIAVFSHLPQDTAGR